MDLEEAAVSDGLATILCAVVFYASFAVLLERVGEVLDRGAAGNDDPPTPGPR